MNGHVYVPIQVHLQKQALGQIWLVGHSLPTPGLNHERLLMRKAMVGLTPGEGGQVSSPASLQFSWLCSLTPKPFHPEAGSKLAATVPGITSRFNHIQMQKGLTSLGF